MLSKGALLTFKERHNYSQPTESIPLKDITAVKSCDYETKREYSFRIDTLQDQTFFFVASTNHEREQWIGQIGKALVFLRKESM